MMGNFAENGNMNPQAQNGYALAQPSVGTIHNATA